jgi:hypothetical protein
MSPATSSKQCTDLDLLDEEVRASSFFTERKAGNSDSSLRQYAGVLRALCLSHDKRDAARLQRYFLAYKAYKGREDALGVGTVPSEHQLANTPTMAEVNRAPEEAGTQGRAFVALNLKVQGRCQNMIITPLMRLMDGTLVHYSDALFGDHVPVEHVGTDGYPVNINAYIVPQDPHLPPVCVQNIYKTTDVYGKKVAVIDADTHELVLAWLQESPNERALFVDTNGHPVDNSSGGKGDTVAGLCKRIFQSVCNKYP